MVPQVLYYIHNRTPLLSVVSHINILQIIYLW